MNYREIKIAVIGLLISVFVFAQSAQAQTCAPAPVGLVSWYPGDGDALDSRSGNNGTLQNGAGFAPGRVGQAFNLDGVDDSVQIPHNANQNINGSFTGEAWIFPRTIPNNSPRIFDKTGGTGYLFAIDQNQQLNATVNSVFIQSPIGSVPLNQWTHAAFTYNGTTGELKIYINGVFSVSTIGLVQTTSTTAPLFIGNQITNVRQFDGLIDEPAIYNRELSASEIQAEFNAGIAGKCKPTATVAPPGQVAWLAGDGSGNDSAGTNNGTLQNGAGFAVGKVGQSFRFDGVDDFVAVANGGSLDFGTGNFSIEFWANLNSLVTDQMLFHKFLGGGLPNDPTYFVEYDQPNALRFRFQSNSADANDLIVPTALVAGQWFHVVAVRSGNTAQLFLNGVSIGSQTFGSNANTGTGGTTIIGKCLPCAGRFVNGKIDEVSLYNRDLSASEIQSVYNAGQAGKLKSANTDLGFGNSDFGFEKDNPQSEIRNPQSVVVPVGDATVTFQSVSASGVTQEIPLDPLLLPPLPNGFNAAGLTYDVATSAVYAGNVDLCFNLGALAAQNFNNLRVFHLEGGAWVNRTAPANTSPNLCTTGVASLSPFAIASFTPTAANVTVAGRVTDESGRGISHIRVSITDGSGATRTTLTNSFGAYRFGDVRSGGIYVVGIISKKYQFSQPTRVIFVNDALADVDFTAVE